MKDEIQVGDLVSVNFNGSQLTLCHRARVMYIAAATGDSWIFKDQSDGKLHNVSEGCTVSLISKGKKS